MRGDGFDADILCGLYSGYPTVEYKGGKLLRTKTLALSGWSNHFASVTAKSYMRGYRDIYSSVGTFHKLMIRFCDRMVRMKIVKIVFGG